LTHCVLLVVQTAICSFPCSMHKPAVVGSTTAHFTSDSRVCSPYLNNVRRLRTQFYGWWGHYG